MYLVVQSFIKMLTFKTSSIYGPPYYRGTVIFNPKRISSRIIPYRGYVISGNRESQLDVDIGFCVYTSPTARKSVVDFDILEVAKAMHNVVRTINDYINEDRNRSRRAGVIFGDPVVVNPV